MPYQPYNLFGILILLLDIVAIVGLLGGRSSSERKLLWTLLILFLPLLGMALYYFIGRNRKDTIAA